MLRIAACVFIAMATVFASNLARAEDDFSRSGLYLGLGGTVAFPISAEDELEDEFGSSADVSESLGLNVRAGIRGKWAAGELHFEWAEGFDVEAGGLDFKLDGWALTLDGKLYPLAGVERKLPPLARRFQPFATVGFGWVNINGPQGLDDGDFAVRIGGGIDVDLTKNIAIIIDATYVLPVSATIDDMDYVSVGWGFLYRF